MFGVPDSQLKNQKGLSFISLLVGLAVATVVGVVSYFVFYPAITKSGLLPAEKTPFSPSEQELKKVLEEGKKITTIKYDLIETVLLGSSLSKTVTLSETVWREEEKARIDFKMQDHTLSTRLINRDRQSAIIYLPDQKLAYREDFDYVVDLQDKELSFPEKGFVECSNWNIIGEETIEGKDCFVAKCPPFGGTYWVWRDYGVPIKNEGKSASGGTITIEYKNMEFDDIPDSIFELPGGVPVLEEGELPPQFKYGGQ